MSMDLVKEVRSRSQAPLGDCKKALDDANGDVEAALLLLQKRGEAKAVAAGGRIATEGQVFSYLHPGSRLAVLVEVNCETDFVARSPGFAKFGEDVAMQIAGMSPQFVRREDVPQTTLDTQMEIFKAQLQKDGKPEKAWPKILEGKLNKWYSEVCLLEQGALSDSEGKCTVEDLRRKLSASVGENVVVRAFVRWELGQGLAKRVHDLAADVAKLTG